MSYQSNEYTYTKQFVGNLRTESEPVPVRVDTKLRVRMDMAAREVEEYKSRAHGAPPKYMFGGRNFPLHRSLKKTAVGRHYFTW